MGKYLEIKDNTKLGYKKAYAGDVLDISYPNSATRRGRVAKNIVHTITTSHNYYYINDNLTLRKITPLETWRLMGFDDLDFVKVKELGLTDKQLYKLAGNSIVVDVLENIFKEMFNNDIL